MISNEAAMALKEGMEDLAKATRTKAMVDKEIAVGIQACGLIQSGKTLEEATTVVNKVFAVRTRP